MIQEMIYGVLGPWSRDVIGWGIANPIPVGFFLTVVLGFWIAGKYQLQKIEERTTIYVRENAKTPTGKQTQKSIEKFYEDIYPGWTKIVKETALFVPHRWELWPVRATPEHVKEHLDFTPEWIEQCLLDGSRETEATEVQSSGGED